MYFSSFVCLLVVSNISFSIGFPFFIRTFPKSIVRYNTYPIPAPIRTIPAFPLSSPFYRRRAPNPYSFNKVDNVYPEEQFIEQRKIDDREDVPSDQSSDLHPIYVLPPPDFQPIVYPTSRSDSTFFGSKVSPPGEYHLNKPQITYDYPNGVSSWMFGGLSGVQKGKYWDEFAKDLAHTPIKAQQPKQVVIYLKRTEPKGQHKYWPTLPIFEAHSVIHENTNTIKTILSKNKDKTINTDQKVMKTKLPVGMTSFFLGGMRGIGGKHWQMPSDLVSKVEFMPNDNIPTTDNKKYKPGVRFDDDNDFYNYNVIKDHK